MFGWRKRIGYIAPTVIEVLAYEFYSFAPDGIGLVCVTCGIDDWRPEEFEKGLAQVKQGALYLASRHVDFIIHGGGPLVVSRGPGYEETIVKEIQSLTQVSATTGVRSALEALRHVGARRIVIASPYPATHDEALSRYLTSFGFEVLRAEGTARQFKEIQNETPLEIYRFACDVISRAPECDTIYLPCPQWQAAQVVAAIEEDSGKTAVAYTHANFFVACRAMGIAPVIKGHGRLLASLTPDGTARRT